MSVKMYRNSDVIEVHEANVKRLRDHGWKEKAPAKGSKTNNKEVK